MNLKKSEWLIVMFNLLYIIGFAIYYVSIRNYEFLWYVGVLVFFFCLIFLTLEKTKFDYVILWGLSLWGFLHMMGGGFVVGDHVLYAQQIIHLFDIGDTYVLAFDQLVHAFGFGVTALVAWHLTTSSGFLESSNHEKKSKHSKDYNKFWIYVFVVAVAMGAGALNEIVEFIAVVVMPETGVGGYYNTTLDLVFNMIGAIIAVIYIHFSKR